MSAPDAWVSGFGAGTAFGILITRLLLTRARREMIRIAAGHFDALCRRLKEENP